MRVPSHDPVPGHPGAAHYGGADVEVMAPAARPRWRTTGNVEDPPAIKLYDADAGIALSMDVLSLGSTLDGRGKQ